MTGAATTGLAVLAFVLLGVSCGGGPGDASRYVEAVAGEGAFDARADLCLGMADPQGRQDCLLAVMERTGRLEAADCARLDAGPWQDECRFLLAERTYRSGRVEEAVAGCGGNRFERACVYHLTRLAARDGAAEAPWVAEARIGPFLGHRKAPDAPRMFWSHWVDEGLAAGRPVDLGTCASLRDPAPCEEAGRARIIRMLDGVFKARGPAFCGEVRAADGSGSLSPGWVDDAAAAGLVARWTAERCPD